MKLKTHGKKPQVRGIGCAWRIVLGALILAAPIASNATDVAAGGRTGKDVVEKECFACHGSGAKGAPKIGDRAAWRTRAAQGLSGLTQTALDGLRQMPAHGGNPQLSDLEIARAITYMVNQSGGRWVEPLDDKALAQGLSGKRVVELQCAQCHRSGAGGAPKIGDKDAWIARLKRGLDYTVRSAINGHGGMPARGGMASLTDSEIQNAILYMFNPTAAVASEPKGKLPPTSAPSANRATVGGMDIYLGLVPAERIRGYPKESPERSVAGGVPRGADYYYINVSLADNKTQAPIANARVEVDVQEVGLTSESKNLEPMSAGPGSYGNYVHMKKNAAYVVTVQVRTADNAGATKARFEYKLQ